MSTIIIYTTRTEDYYKLGTPAAHTLTEPSSVSRDWIDRAEYELPNGYTATEAVTGELAVYNAAGRHCPLMDSGYHGRGRGRPVLMDGDLALSTCTIRLDKVRDLPW